MIKKATNVQYGYTIEGNTIQDGVPSPQNPVTPEGTGDKTGNLLPLSDKTFTITAYNSNLTVTCSSGNLYFSGTVGEIPSNYTSWKTNFAFELEAGTYYCNNPSPLGSGFGRYIRKYSDDTTILGATDYTFTLSETTKLYLAFYIYNKNLDNQMELMLNIGSEALPYEPYGYKLDILSSGENLFDPNSTRYHMGKGTSNRIGYFENGAMFYIKAEPNTAYTIKIHTTDSTFVRLYLSNAPIVEGVGESYNVISESETAQNPEVTISNTTYAYLWIQTGGTWYTEHGGSSIMLNRGSTPLPYEPYIEPIEADIYLGQVQTTRNIKKLVLTGQESVGFYRKNNTSDDNNSLYYIRFSEMQSTPLNGSPLYCTHLQNLNYTPAEVVGINVGSAYNVIYFNLGSDVMNTQPSGNTVTGLREYLASQYATGTPVTVWYVTAEPETTVVNEPLMKIGNYVDTINNTQSGIDITTNNLTVNTTISPSKIDITSTATWIPIPYNKYNTETISTIAPIDFLSNGQNITVGLKGNVEQLEIPSPDNPIMPDGTGEKTGNLCLVSQNNSITYDDYNNYIISNNSITSTGQALLGFKCKVEPNTLYTISIKKDSTANLVRIREYSSEPTDWTTNFLIQSINTDQTSATFTTSPDTTWILVTFWFSTAGHIMYDIMLNISSAAEPYQPYGYVINIINNTESNHVYLGEVQSIRRIRKLVLTGEENWTAQAAQGGNRFVLLIQNAIVSDTSRINSMCSHFPLLESGGTYIKALGYTIVNSSIYLRYDPIETVADFKSYLAAQYAAGTPVCVWYVLSEPETAVVNEPLMKIGNYADEVSNIAVPTTKGSNTLSITTSVQPSNVQLSISGWVPHNNVKEYKNNAWMATSWEGFRDIVRAGNGPTRYPIGTKLYETWGDNTSNAWIIVDYDNSNYNDPDISALGYTHNVVLYEEKINYLKVFDNAEAWLYTESVLPAGTYRFTIPNYDATYGGNKTYIFTSTVDVPIHGQLTLSWPYQQNPASVSAYITNTSTTALFTATVSEWDGTTTSEDLGTIKLAMTDPDSTYGKLNHIHRARYGSNNYYQSGIRQWMNADATANNWWKPTNIFDRPYSNRTTDGGLYLMDKDFRKVIAAPNITCITNNIFETGTSGSTAFKLQTQYTIRDKIFLPTHTELNLSSSPNIGTVFSQYTNAGNDDRIKYRKDNGNAYYYWFRTPYPSNGYTVRRVNSSGAWSDTSAINTIGAVRACIIQ